MDKKTFNLIRQALRAATLKWDTRNEVLKEAKVYLKTYKKNGDLSKRKRVKFKCNACKKLFRQQEVEVDHIKPVGSFNQGWDTVINNMFCEKDNLQVLCKRCHKEKGKAPKVQEPDWLGLL